MKYAEQIAQEMEARKLIDKTDVMYDETWEDYMRGGKMTRKEAIENLKEVIDTYITCHGEEDSVAVSIDNVDVEALDMAIKALKHLDNLKSGRFISLYNQVAKERDIAIEQLHELGYEFGQKIEPRWIPVSEKLPKERIAVLVYCPERKNIYCACYEEKQWWIFGAYFKRIEEDVIAWMPLPKPYRDVEET